MIQQQTHYATIPKSNQNEHNLIKINYVVLERIARKPVEHLIYICV